MSNDTTNSNYTGPQFNTSNYRRTSTSGYALSYQATEVPPSSTTHKLPAVRRPSLQNNSGARVSMGDQIDSFKPPVKMDSSLPIVEKFWPNVGLITFFSTLGVLIRVSLVALNTYPSEPVFPLIFPQIFGCFIMGIVNHRKQELSQYYHPLFIGIGTGLCGSITTFSSFMILTFRNLVSSPTFSLLGSHIMGINFLAAFAVIFLTFSTAIASIFLGETFSNLLPAQLFKVSNKQQRRQSKLDAENHGVKQTRGFNMKLAERGITTADIISMILGVSSMAVLAVFIAVSNSRVLFFITDVAIACLFGPVGSLVRWQLAKLNKIWPNSFPIGTFLANVGGTVILAVVNLTLIRVDGEHLSPIIFSVMVAVSDGFCGCLTTLSTMANELINLPVHKGIMYAGTSILISQIAIGALIFPFALPPTTTPVLVPTVPISYCPSFTSSCNQFLIMIGCPTSQSVNIGCSGNEATFVGSCMCGKLDASTRISESLIDNQLKPFIPRAMNTTFVKAGFAGGQTVNGPAPVAAGKDANALVAYNKPLRRDGAVSARFVKQKGFAVDATTTSVLTSSKTGSTMMPTTVAGTGENNGNKGSKSPAVQKALLAVLPNIAAAQHLTSDMCTIYPAACSGLMDQIRCPVALRNITGGCTDGTPATFTEGCLCGGVDAGTRVRELLIDSQIKGDIPYLKIHQPPITANGNWSMAMCPSYARTCDTLMTKMNCPTELIQNVACNGTTPDTFVGTCTCGQLTADERVREDLIDNDVKPQVKDFIYSSTKFTFFNTVDFCPTYTAVCQEFLNRMGCPIEMSMNNACNGGATADAFAGECACAEIDAGCLSQRIYLVAQPVNEKPIKGTFKKNANSRDDGNGNVTAMSTVPTIPRRQSSVRVSLLSNVTPNATTAVAINQTTSSRSINIENAATPTSTKRASRSGYTLLFDRLLSPKPPSPLTPSIESPPSTDVAVPILPVTKEESSSAQPTAGSVIEPPEPIDIVERFWPSVGLITFFSTIGVLIRVSLVALNTYQSEPVL
ncbi:hypothetical protein HDU76_008138 [Blyttiomyces sp. JEL0837]|nr:hypothetical protein HDU76_008138 [Blyttiomyces sp. JEL0837]